MKKWIFCVATILALCSGVSNATALDDAVAAYDRGDYVRAIRLWRPMAEKGNALAQFSLGIMYANGRGVTQNYREAVKWFRLVAAQGHVEAQNNLGLSYANGYGVDQDYREAARWFRLAAAQGLEDAQYNLGALYFNGQGLVKNYVRAHMWVSLAAAKGFGDAQKYRDEIARTMTLTQIAEAQKLARECAKRNYKKCD